MSEPLHSGRALHSRTSRIRSAVFHPIEPLEPRLLLSGSEADFDDASGTAGLGSGAAVQSMNLRPAAFIENLGQWADPDLFYLWNARGAAIAHKATGPVIQLRKAVVPETNPATAPTTPGALFSSTGSSLTAPSTGQTVDQPHLNTGTSALPNLELVPELAIDQPLDLATIPDPFGRDAAPLNFEIHNVFMRFEGANTVRPRGLELAQGYHNFYVGDPSLHRSNVPGFTSVIYENLYDGIDLVMLAGAGGGDHLKYEFHLAPGADPGQIRIAWEGLEDLKLTPAADGLQMQTPVGTLTDSGLYVYQTGEMGEEPIAARFGLDEAGRVSFQITGEYDAGRKLVIDPEVAWGTYIGSGSIDRGTNIATDLFGNILVTGLSFGWNPMGGYDTNLDGSAQDGLVVKMNQAGQHLWSTYLGGSQDDQGHDITIDSLNNVIVVGYTASQQWISGGFDVAYAGSRDAFVVKLTSSGSHTWSSYLGNGGEEHGYGVSTDTMDNVIIVGHSSSNDWTLGGLDISNNGREDAFVVKLSPMGNHLWSTFIGGINEDIAFGVATGDLDSIVVTGLTRSAGLAAGGHDIIWGGDYDIFVLKLDSAGGHLWSSYFGDGYADYGYDIVIDEIDNIFVTGDTHSSQWVMNGHDTEYDGGDAYGGDAFVLKLGPLGEYHWATLVGGPGSDAARSISLADSGDIVIAGRTNYSGWTLSGHDVTYNGGIYDGFVAKLNKDSDPIWSSYLGGSLADEAYGVAIDSIGNIFVSGYTESPHWTNDIYFPHSPRVPGDVYAEDAFVLKIISPPPGDFNRDIVTNSLDIDLLHTRLRSGSPFDSRYDLNADAQITRLDADYLIREILDTEYGDADLNGLVSIGDLVVLAQHYNLLEFGASWAQGDFNGNGSVTLGDLTILAEHFGFARGPAALAGEAESPAALLWGLQALGAAPAAADEDPEEDNPLADILGELAAGDSS